MPTIEELEKDRWSDPGPDATYLIRTCTALRRKPLADFTVEDMRIMIGQQIGVRILIPCAVTVLTHDLLAEGDFYPGDLLGVVVRLPDEAWTGLEDQRQQLAQTLAGSPLEIFDPTTRSAVSCFLGR
jgi:hypothetical protein